MRRCGLIALDIHVVAILGPSWTRDGLRISLLSEARGARRTRVRLRARPSLRLDLLAPETASGSGKQKPAHSARLAALPGRERDRHFLLALLQYGPTARSKYQGCTFDVGPS